MTTHTFKDLAAAAMTSSYKWLTSTLLTAQQAFSVRPYFTAQVIDDLITPLNQWFSGAGLPLAQGSMATAPDGKVFAVGLDGSNNLAVWNAVDLNVAAGVWPNKTTLNTAGFNNFVDPLNKYSIAISDFINGSYRIDIFFFYNFANDGTGLKIGHAFSDNGGQTWSVLTWITTTYLNDSLGNVSLAAAKPLYSGGSVTSDCFYIQKNTASFSSGFAGYDILHGLGPYTWQQNANSYDWSIHSLSAFYFNNQHFVVFSGFRNILDAVGSNPNYSLWITSLITNAPSNLASLWSQAVSVLPVGSATSTNLNSFTFPMATVSNGMIYITTKATLVDSVSQTAQGNSSVIVTTHTNYMLIQSDDAVGFSYPTILVGTDGVEFNSGTGASFILQNAFWYLGGAAGFLWQLSQNNIVADVTPDVVGYSIQETAGQPSAANLQIANANGKWVGASPTGPGAAAIARNRKIAIWQGYYNASGVPEAVPHSVYFIDDIKQNITGTQNDVTLVGRDLYKKLKTTITKFSYQMLGPTFFADIFDGTFISNWNPLSGTWSFKGSLTPPLLQVIHTAGEDDIILVGSNGSSYGHFMRLFFRYASGTSAKAYFYAVYINTSNWIRLELNCQDGTSWAITKSVGGSITTVDSGTIPFTMSASGSHYYGIYIRRYSYYRFGFMIDAQGDNVGNAMGDYSPSTTSYLFGGTEYDLSSVFSANASWQVPFTVGFGSTSLGPTDFRFFFFTQYNNRNNLGTVMRRLARIAGIFTFKLTYLWRELLYVPNLTGTYTIQNRVLQVLAGNTALSNSNTFSNGEVSFRAKIAVANSANPAGFKFVFRASSASSPTDAYYFHLIQQSTGFDNPPTYCRFERIWASAPGTTYIFYNSPNDVSNNPSNSAGPLRIDFTQWHTYRLVAVDGWFYAFIDDIMVASWNDNNTSTNFLTSGNWGFIADTNTTLSVSDIQAPDFWKPVPTFSFNPGDDSESAIESLITSLRGWIFSDLLGRFKSVLLNSTDPSTYNYNAQLFQQQVDNSDKEYVAQVTVYGNGVSATARNSTLMPGVILRDLVIVDYTIATLQDAQTRATNELKNAGQYTNQYTPKQVMNVGAELFDVATITNTGSNTSGVSGTTRTYSQSFSEGGGNNNSDYSLELDTGTV